jgi:NADH-quinone oxidoreductase subunit M
MSGPLLLLLDGAPLLTLAVLVPMASALLALLLDDRRALMLARVASTIAFVVIAAAAWRHFLHGAARTVEPFTLSFSPLVPDGGPRALLVTDALNVGFLVIYAVLSLAVFVALPRQDARPSTLAGILWTGSLTTLVYTADHVWVFVGALALTTVPLLLGVFVQPLSSTNSDGSLGPRKRASFIAALFPLLAAILVGVALSLDAGTLSAGPFFDALSSTERAPSSRAAFLLVLTAVLLRKGVFPLHLWTGMLTRALPIVPLVFFLNAHTGVFIAVRVLIPLSPDEARTLLPAVGYFALFSTLILAISGLARRDPRRIVVAVLLSQSSAVLVGVATGNALGVTGALVLVQAIAVGSMGLAIALRALVVRFSGELPAGRWLGLASVTPRLSVFVALTGLACVGFPGTLAFCAEDLLLHGAVEAHRDLSAGIAIATALNAINIVLLYASTFLGKARVSHVRDLFPREAYALLVLSALVVGAGLLPSPVVSERARAAASFVSTLDKHSQDSH